MNNDWFKEQEQQKIKDDWRSRIIERMNQPVTRNQQIIFDWLAYLIMFSIAFVLIAACLRIGWKLLT